MTDLLRLGLSALLGHRLRSLLSVLGVAIGIASVVLLTSIGEGTRTYLIRQFTQFGTNIVAVNPGKSETLGIPGASVGSTHKLDLDDAAALARLPGVQTMVPAAFGTGRVEAAGRARDVFVYGTTPKLAILFKTHLRSGRFWPEGDLDRAPFVAVLGPTVAREIFPLENPLGRFIRISGTRYRVIGVMAPKGKILGFDLDDAVFIPVASALRLFNTDELVEIDLLYDERVPAQRIVDRVKEVLIRRHDGKEDFTVVSQEAMLEVFGNVMDVITMSVGAIAGISLLVGAVGILTMMWIAVGERTAEIGVSRAIGASRGQIVTLFLFEAAALAVVGGAIGTSIGLSLCGLLRLVVPGLPVETPPIYVALALLVSVATGLLSGALPARRAARLDPIEALRAE